MSLGQGAAWVAALIVCTAPIAAASQELRLTPAEIAAALAKGGAGAGTSGVAGIQTTVLYRDPTKPVLYVIEIRIPANTRIAAHRHRDDRTAVVVSGTWWFGYGLAADEAAVKPLPPGSFYAEPAGRATSPLPGPSPWSPTSAAWAPPTPNSPIPRGRRTLKAARPLQPNAGDTYGFAPHHSRPARRPTAYTGKCCSGDHRLPARPGRFRRLHGAARTGGQRRRGG
ncbi:exported hypothetical protein [Mesorhizobium delmotii]|uniref:Cupin 2 conserved barrel domain-containing protein n=1 Tax=Mesorhizobium delmotii TaxID=1631247 RepID=A0A2P9ARV1_9HYPH|nr:exported hypothetical protein [Mesorhizobium delmotii]